MLQEKEMLLDCFPVAWGLCFDKIDADFLLSTLWNSRHNRITACDRAHLPTS